MAPDRFAPVFSRECVELFSELTQLFGVPRSVGQIYGLLYASPQPLCFSDIVEQLGISKGSASQGLQFLKSLGAIRAAASPLPRNRLMEAPGREYFEPELSLRKLISGILQERIAPLARTGTARLRRIREVAARSDEHGSFYLDRSRQLDIWQRRLKTALPVLRMMLAAPKAK